MKSPGSFLLNGWYCTECLTESHKQLQPIVLLKKEFMSLVYKTPKLPSLAARACRLVNYISLTAFPCYCQTCGYYISYDIYVDKELTLMPLELLLINLCMMLNAMEF